MRPESDRPGSRDPVVTETDAGPYYWCQCGKTKMPPWCDGSHEGTRVMPLEFTVDEQVTQAIRDCGRNGSAANCDGSHANIGAGPEEG